MSDIEIYFEESNSGIQAFNPDTKEVYKLDGKYYFPNKNLLLSKLEKNHITKYDFQIINNGDIIPYSKVIESPSNDLYEGIIDGEKLYICPKMKETMICCGYFHFVEDPYELITDKELGKAINIKSRKIINDAICYMVRSGKLHKKELNAYAKYYYRIPGSTIGFRVMSCYDLVKENEYRKSLEERIFPFKKVDRFSSIYFCFTKDNHEHCDYKKIINQLLNDITIYITNKYNEEVFNLDIVNNNCNIEYII